MTDDLQVCVFSAYDYVEAVLVAPDSSMSREALAAEFCDLELCGRPFDSLLFASWLVRDKGFKPVAFEEW